MSIQNTKLEMNTKYLDFDQVPSFLLICWVQILGSFRFLPGLINPPWNILAPQRLPQPEFFPVAKTFNFKHSVTLEVRIIHLDETKPKKWRLYIQLLFVLQLLEASNICIVL